MILVIVLPYQSEPEALNPWEDQSDSVGFRVWGSWLRVEGFSGGDLG